MAEAIRLPAMHAHLPSFTTLLLTLSMALPLMIDLHGIADKKSYTVHPEHCIKVC